MLLALCDIVAQFDVALQAAQAGAVSQARFQPTFMAVAMSDNAGYVREPKQATSSPR
jgi:hypothetical protein